MLKKLIKIAILSLILTANIRNFGKGANKYINYSLDQSKKINNLFIIKQIFIQSTARYLSSYGAKMVSNFFFNKSFKSFMRKKTFIH